MSPSYRRIERLFAFMVACSPFAWSCHRDGRVPEQLLYIGVALWTATATGAAGLRRRRAAVRPGGDGPAAAHR